MIDPNVGFVVFTLAIPLVLLVLKYAKVVLSPDARQIVAAILAVAATALQIWLTGAWPVFQGDALAIAKLALGFFAGQMALYEVLFKRIFAAFE